MMTMGVAELGGAEILAGRLAGEAAERQLRRTVGAASRGQSPLVLDFCSIKIITASYFLGAFGYLWSSQELLERQVFPVLANLNSDSLEEVTLGLQSAGLKGLVGRLAGGILQDVTPQNLDLLEQLTYDAVEQLTEATAADLFRRDSSIQPTAWSNRLVLLHNHRLLRRRKVGRQLAYTAAWRHDG